VLLSSATTKPPAGLPGEVSPETDFLEMVVTGAPRAGATVTCDSNLLREVVEANARWMAVRRSAVTGRVSEPTICKVSQNKSSRVSASVHWAMQQHAPLSRACVHAQPTRHVSFRYGAK
jgi:hypothetical protein